MTDQQQREKLFKNIVWKEETTEDEKRAIYNEFFPPTQESDFNKFKKILSFLDAFLNKKTKN